MRNDVPLLVKIALTLIPFSLVPILAGLYWRDAADTLFKIGLSIALLAAALCYVSFAAMVWGIK